MILKKFAGLFSRVIDFVYVGPFKIIPLETFRYAAVGGTNMLFGIVNYWFIYNYILFQHDIPLTSQFMVTAPIAAFSINLVVNFMTGFWLMRNVTFPDSRVKSRHQLICYATVTGLNIVLNYFGLKSLIAIGIYPSIANAILQPILALLSYLLNSHISFRR